MSSDENPKLKVTFILDVIGKPAKHLVEALDNVSKEMDGEKGTEVKNKKIKEPTSIKDRPEFFTTFAELDAEFESIDHLMASVFKYMPAHIEIIHPEVVALSNNRLNEIINELTRRLHGYDEIARAMQLDNKKLRAKIKEATGEVPITSMTPKSELTEKQRKELEKENKKSKKSSKKKSSKKKKSKK